MISFLERILNWLKQREAKKAHKKRMKEFRKRSPFTYK